MEITCFRDNCKHNRSFSCKKTDHLTISGPNEGYTCRNFETGEYAPTTEEQAAADLLLYKLAEVYSKEYPGQNLEDCTEAPLKDCDWHCDEDEDICYFAHKNSNYLQDFIINKAAKSLIDTYNLLLTGAVNRFKFE